MTRNLWLSLFAVTISVMIHYAIPNDAKWMADSAVLGIAAGVCWTWGAAAGRAVSRGARTGIDKVILTVWLAWCMYFVQRFYVLINKDQWLTGTLVPHLIATFILLAGMFALAAPHDSEEELPKGQMIFLAIGWLITGLVAGGAAVYALLTTGL